MGSSGKLRGTFNTAPVYSFFGNAKECNLPTRFEIMHYNLLADQYSSNLQPWSSADRSLAPQH